MIVVKVIMASQHRVYVPAGRCESHDHLMERYEELERLIRNPNAFVYLLCFKEFIFTILMLLT